MLHETEGMFEYGTISIGPKVDFDEQCNKLKSYQYLT